MLPATTKDFVTIRLVTDDSLISRIIRSGEMGFGWSHVECRFPDGSTIGAHADGGVLKHPKGYDDGWSSQLFIDLPCETKQAHLFESYLILQLGKPYDMEAIGQMAEGVFTSREALPDTTSCFICSALIASALQYAGIPKSPFWSTRLTTPRDIYTICAALTKVGPGETRNTPHQ